MVRGLLISAPGLAALLRAMRWYRARTVSHDASTEACRCRFDMWACFKRHNGVWCQYVINVCGINLPETLDTQTREAVATRGLQHGRTTGLSAASAKYTRRHCHTNGARLQKRETVFESIGAEAFWIDMQASTMADRPTHHTYQIPQQSPERKAQNHVNCSDSLRSRGDVEETMHRDNVAATGRHIAEVYNRCAGVSKDEGRTS